MIYAHLHRDCFTEKLWKKSQIYFVLWFQICQVSFRTSDKFTMPTTPTFSIIIIFLFILAMRLKLHFPRILECRDIDSVVSITRNTFNIFVLAKWDRSAGEVQATAVGGEMLLHRRGACKRYGWEYCLRLLERYVDGVFFTFLQRLQSHRRAGARWRI